MDCFMECTVDDDKHSAVMPVSAEEVSALEQAKLCIDTILTAAPAAGRLHIFGRTGR